MKIKEQLSPDIIQEQISLRIDELELLLKQKKEILPKYPQENLRITSCEKRTQFYKTEKGNSLGKYISTSKKKYINTLLQKKYDTMLVSEIEKELKKLKWIKAKYENCNIEKIFFKLPKSCRARITPVLYPKEELLLLFEAQNYEALPFTDEIEYRSETGLRVRSKSETIIADLLTRKNIPFKYEMPKVLENEHEKITLHPDFTCLNVKTHEIFLWEHFGIIDEINYANNTVSKLNLYQKNGFYPGKNLIITMETKNNPLTSKMVSGLIDNYF